MDTIATAEIERGDVLLISRRPHDAFADLIVALDGAPAKFSHSGIALGNGRMMSSYPFFDGVSFPVDLGGLHADSFDHFWSYGQSIHRVAVDPAERRYVAGGLGRYALGPGSFSVPKIVMVAATLHALSPSNPIAPEATARVVRRALVAAEAWADDGDFYCAEFVAKLYGWRFTLADLVPPRWTRRIAVPHLARLSVDVVGPVLTAYRTEEQKDSMQAFLAEVRRSDRAFFGPRPFATLTGILDEVAGRLGFEPDPDDAVDLLAASPVDDSPLDLTTVVPPGLVTPRMLRTRHVGDGDPPRIEAPTADRC